MQRLLIGGQWTEASSGGSFERTNPYTGEPAGTAAAAKREDARAAADAAAEAFPEWSASPPSQRRELLQKAAALLTERARAADRKRDLPRERLDGARRGPDAVRWGEGKRLGTLRWHGGPRGVHRAALDDGPARLAPVPALIGGARPRAAQLGQLLQVLGRSSEPRSASVIASVKPPVRRPTRSTRMRGTLPMLIP